MKARVPVDEVRMAKLRKDREVGEQALAEQCSTRADANAAAKAEKAASDKASGLAAAEAAALQAARLKPLIPEEMKAAPEAGYAARQARKR